jgi:hypothetical protein
MSAVAQSSEVDISLINVWKLDSVDIRKLTGEGDTIRLVYNETEYKNSLGRIFPKLTFERSKVIIGQYEIAYSISNDTITLWYTAPIIYKYKTQNNRVLFLYRKYVLQDGEFQVFLKYKRE